MLELVVRDGGLPDGPLETMRALDEPRLGLVADRDGGTNDTINRDNARATG